MSASRTEPEDGIKSVWNCSTSSPRRGSAAFKAVGNVIIPPWTHLSSFFLLEMKQNRVFLPSKVSTVSDFYYRNVFSISIHFYVYKVLNLIKTNTKWKKKNKIRLQGYNFCEVAATHWFSILNGLFLRVFCRLSIIIQLKNVLLGQVFIMRQKPVFQCFVWSLVKP